MKKTKPNFTTEVVEEVQFTIDEGTYRFYATSGNEVAVEVPCGTFKYFSPDQADEIARILKQIARQARQ